MTARQFYTGFFWLAAIYDVLLGLAFFAGYQHIYGWAGIALPNHPAYVQLPALWIAIMGIADVFVASDLVRNRAIVTIRILMKLAFSVLCIYYYALGQLPGLFLTIAIGNVVFLIPQFLFFRFIPSGSHAA